MQAACTTQHAARCARRTPPCMQHHPAHAATTLRHLCTPHGCGTPSKTSVRAGCAATVGAVRLVFARFTLEPFSAAFSASFSASAAASLSSVSAQLSAAPFAPSLALALAAPSILVPSSMSRSSACALARKET
eukprot:750355-Prymnesium_polylepis.2